MTSGSAAARQRQERQEYRWASEVGAHDMPAPEELEWFGYRPVLRNGEIVRDWRYPSSVLMVREA